jgi:hypothetical protein
MLEKEQDKSDDSWLQRETTEQKRENAKKWQTISKL